MKQNEIILEARHLKKYFKTGRKLLRAVDDVSFFIRKGETLGLVGESGCGKTTCGRTCIGIYERTDGEVLYKGKDIHALKGREERLHKGSADYFPGSLFFPGSENEGRRDHRRGASCPQALPG